MAEMIRLFLELKNYLPGPLNELSYPGEFPTDGEIEKLVELSESLKVDGDTVNFLGRRDCTMVHGDKLIIRMLKKSKTFPRQGMFQTNCMKPCFSRPRKGEMIFRHF